jgi:hypothetical protein
LMGTLTISFVQPSVVTGKFGVLFAAEDNTAGTAFVTSDASGFAHVGYARVDVPLSGTTIGGTVYGTALNNNMALVAPATRILNLFPNDSLTAISIRRGRTRLDQYDDVGECTIEVLNTSGDSDPDNNTGRYQRLTTPTINAGTTVAQYGSFIRPGMYAQIVYGGTAGAIPLFTGMIETVEPTDDRVSTATYTLVDRMAQLGRTTTINGAKVGANRDTGNQRLNAICQIARLSDVYNGNGGANLVEQVVNIQGFNRRVQLGSLGDSAMDCLKTIVNGEAGRIFAGRDGKVNIWNRAYMQTQGTTMAGTFTDTPATVAGFGYDEIQTNQGQNFLYNSSFVTVGSAVTASARVDESIALYGERKYEVECALADSVADGLALVTFLATEWSVPSKNVASISVQTYGMSQANFETIARIELQQGLRVYRRLPGGRTLDVNCVVEGIEIDIDPSNRRFTFYLSPRDTTSITWPT